MLPKLAHWIDGLTEKAGQLATGLVILTIGVGFYHVMARYIGRWINVRLSSNTFIELQWYLFSLIFLLGFPALLKHGSNVRVDFLYMRWSIKHRALVDLLGTLPFACWL